ncbi:MAG: triose-phosphate isomerase [Candidatus Omnitrophica bacterium]|nr:triose-phosphate isomerase [Candidatus Omnitrophota bacterium]
MWRKISSLLISLCLVFQQIGFASIATELNLAGHLSKMSGGFVQDRFRPVHIRFFSFDSQNDNIKVMLDKGDIKELKGKQLDAATQELLNYFLVGINLPSDKFWVNLRPDSEDNIIDDYLARTDVGKIMLETDLQLKKDTAQFTSPETPEGREYWNRLYKKAEELYGYQEVTIPTLTRPWIVPNEIIVRQTNDSAYIYKATLKVMLEQDFLKDSATYSFKDSRAKALNEYSSQLIRELIIPKLTKEVNLSKRYASLRQVYYSIILSRWFKSHFTGQEGKYASRIDRKDLTGLTSAAAWSKSTYFNAYKKSFAQGEYNIKETVRTPTGQVIRSYFSGGQILTGLEVDARMQGATFNITTVVDTLLPTLKGILVDASGTPTAHELTRASMSSPVKVAINNPGAQERELIREWLLGKSKDVELVGVNGVSADNLYYLLTKDFSATPAFRNWFNKNFQVLPEGLGRNGKLVLKVSAISNPKEFPWKELNAQAVIEGQNPQLAASHKSQGAQFVIVTNPALTAVSALRPVLSLIPQETIRGVSFTDVQPPSSLQRGLDNSGPDPVLMRSSGNNIAPALSRDIDEYVGKMFSPDLSGRIKGRVHFAPQMLGCILDVKMVLNSNTDVASINKIFKDAAEGALRGKLVYSEDNSKVSLDTYKQAPIVVLGKQTKVTGKNMVHLQVLHNEDTTFALSQLPLMLDGMKEGKIASIVTSKDSQTISEEIESVLSAAQDAQSQIIRPKFLDTNSSYIPSLDGKSRPRFTYKGKPMQSAIVGENGPGRTGRTIAWAMQGDPNVDLRMINGPSNMLIISWLLAADSIQQSTPKPVTRIILTPKQLKKEISQLLNNYTEDQVKGIINGQIDSQRLYMLQEKEELVPYLEKLLVSWGKPRAELQSSINWLLKSLVGVLDINGKKVLIVNERKAVSELPWDVAGIKIIAESSGDLKNADDAMAHLTHIKGGKVIITAPAEGVGQSIVLGVVEPTRAALTKDNASCTTNALMPVGAVLDEPFENEISALEQEGLPIEGRIVSQDMLTVHGYTTDQNFAKQDLHKKEPVRGRSALGNAEPASTGAAKTAAKIFPSLTGKSDGWAIRTPNPTGSVVDLLVVRKGKVTKEQIQNAFRKASQNKFAGLLAYTQDPITSATIVGNPASTIVDGNSIEIVDYDDELDQTIIRLETWYDNETGFSNRMVNLIVYENAFSHIKGKVIADIGPASVELDMKRMQEVFSAAGDKGTVLWNGPMGVAEVESTSYGTKGTAKNVLSLPKTIKKIVGGGDTIATLSEKERDQFDYVSMAGGAFLEAFKFGVENLPGVKVLIDPVTGELSQFDSLLQNVKEGDTVFLRIDGNVPLDSNLNITDNSRLRAILPTAQALLAKKVKLIVATHLGRPNGKVDEKLRTDPVAKELQRLLGVPVYKLDDCIGKPVEDFIQNTQKNGEVVFLENLRFRLAEELNNEAFAQALSRIAKYYVNDSFSVDHRAHASVQAITRFFALGTKFAGLSLANEYTYLKQLRNNPVKPLVVILAGAKLDTKIDLFDSLKKETDLFIIGGRMALAFLAAQGKKVGDSMPDQLQVQIASKLLADPELKNKFVLPVDGVVVSNISTGEDATVVKGDVEPSDMSAFKQQFVEYLKSYLPYMTAEGKAAAAQESLANLALQTGTELENQDIPASFGKVLTDFGLKKSTIKVVRLQGNFPTKEVLKQPTTRAVIETSIGQAMGSILYAGVGTKQGKNIADANAVEFSRRSLVSFIEANPLEAIIVIADEGERDDAVSLKRGRIYWKGYAKGYWDPDPENFFKSLEAEVNELRKIGVNINYFAGDALEHTNGLIVKEAATQATNSWSLAALFKDLPGGIRRTVWDKFRIAGVSFNAPRDAGVQPLDLPSIATRRIAVALARQKGIEVTDPAFTGFYADFMNHLVILTLGSRDKDLAKQPTQSGDSRHLRIIEDAKQLQEKYPGIKLLTPDDGDFAPRAVASLGLDLDGYKMMVFGRSGSAEATIAELVAALVPNGQFSHRFVSEKMTAKDVSPQTADSFTEEDLRMFDALGYSADAQRRTYNSADFQGSGTFAITAVTGASEKFFGPTFSDLMQRVTFNNAAGTVTTNTLTITPDGSVFVIRTEFQTKDPIASQNRIKRASPEAVLFLTSNSGREFLLPDLAQPRLNFADVKALDAALTGIVEVTTDGYNILNEPALRSVLIDQLVYDATFNPNQEIVNKSRQLIKGIAASLGINLGSVHNLYVQKAKDPTHYTVPAINIRGMAYDTARAALKSAVKNNVTKVILEIAKSEIKYTGQRPIEFTTSMLAAAIKEGYNQTLYLQGDHFQIALKDYLKNPEKAIQDEKELITEALEAGFYQIDVDLSQLVDWNKLTHKEQQELNYKLTAELTRYIRKEERRLGLDKLGIVVNLGGEIGEIGMGLDKAKQKNSTVEDLRAFMDGYNPELRRLSREEGLDLESITKIAVQTGTKHGGVRDAQGKLAKAKVGFNTLGELGKVAREEYGLAGVVQHGASTLPEPYFIVFAGNPVPEGTRIDEELLNSKGEQDLNEHPVTEVHLATAYQDTEMDHPELPADLGNEMKEYVLGLPAAQELIQKGTDVNKALTDNRKNAWGPFKLYLWNLPESVKTPIRDSLERQFDTVYKNLGVAQASSAAVQVRRTPFVGGNWKMAVQTPEEAVKLVEDIAAKISNQGGVEIVIAPFYVHIPVVSNALRKLVSDDGKLDPGAIKIAAQNMYSEEKGAFTAGISAAQLKQYGVTYVILGHSEVRRNAKQEPTGESNANVNRKIVTALKNGLIPIVCVGESAKEKADGDTQVVVRNQIKESLAGISSEEDAAKIIVAYEPVWAIGTGKTPTPQEAEVMHSYIRDHLYVMFGVDSGAKIRILYGGSVTDENIAGFMAEPDIDGVLVDGASLKADSFSGIVKASASSAVFGSEPSLYGPHPSQAGLRPLFERIAWARNNAPDSFVIKDIYAFVDQKHGMDPKESISFGMVLADDHVITQNAPVMGGISAGSLEPDTHTTVKDAIEFFNKNVRQKLIGLNIARPDAITEKIIQIDEELRAQAKDKERPQFSYIGSELSVGISMISTIALAEELRIPTEVVMNYRYNEYAISHGLATEVRPMSIPINFGVVWEGGKHGVAKSLPDLVKEGIIKDDSRFPARFKEAPNDKKNLLAMVPPQELQTMVFAPNWAKARDIGIKLTTAYQKLLNQKYGIKTKYGAESGFTTDQMRDKNGNVITLNLALDILDEAVSTLKPEEAKFVRYALDIAASEMYIPEIDMYYIGPEAAGNNDGLVTNGQFTQYKLALFKKYSRFISCEDWADEGQTEHWNDAKMIMSNMIQMGDDNVVSKADLIRKYKDVMNAHLQKPNQSGEESVSFAAVATSHKLGNVVVWSHRGTRSPQEVYTAQGAIGTGSFAGKWTLLGPGRSALIAAMTQANALYNKGPYGDVVVPYQGALVLDPNGPYKDYGFAKRLRAEIGPLSAEERIDTSASSALKKDSSPENAGGIDFRPNAMLINYQPMGNFANLKLKLPVLSKAELAGFNVDKELSGIERMVDSQMVPSGQRIKELLAACSQKGELDSHREQLMALLVRIGILEETQCCLQEASNEYKEALVLTDSLT